MTSKTARRLGIAGGAAVSAAALAAVALAATATGPSSSQSPYLTPSVPGVDITSILTVGDSVNTKPDGVTPYRMVGIPDGLGAYRSGNGTFTVLMNHELGGTAGVTRAHGAAGSFVSKWTIRTRDLKVLKGEDLIRRVRVWNGTSYVDATPAQAVLNRLCSADLPARGAFHDQRSKTGYEGRIFMNGEEAGAEGRAFAHVVDGPEAGTSYELPHLGRFSWENSITQPGTGRRTVVVGTDDSTPGQVYVYVGEKRATGNPVERAGLVGGTLYGVRVAGVARETDGGIPSGTEFELVSLGDVSGKTGAALQTESVAAGVTEFLRPEDGAWNPRNDGQFLFVTTNSLTAPSRLWSLDFTDRSDVTRGGTIRTLLDGTEGQRMMDNMTVTDRGQVLIQEDPGAQDHLAKVWSYSLQTDTLTEVAGHDANRFAPGAPGFLTRDEESSGIIPVDDILGEGWFLADVQAHGSIAATEPELVERGQLLAIRLPRGLAHGRDRD